MLDMQEATGIPDYERLYKFLFNGLTDLVEGSPPRQVVELRELPVLAGIKNLQCRSEELFVETSLGMTIIQGCKWVGWL